MGGSQRGGSTCQGGATPGIVLIADPVDVHIGGGIILPFLDLFASTLFDFCITLLSFKTLILT
jgi:hypothetical protein